MAAAKKHLVAIFAAAGLLALGGYAYYVNQAAPPAPQAPAGAPAPGKGGGPSGGFAIGVETVRVATSVFVDDVAAVGSLKSNESVVLRPEIAGRIAAIHLREGMPAAKGAVLVALDASTQAAELRQAEANLALSQANYRRTEDLYQKKFVAERARDEAAEEEVDDDLVLACGVVGEVVFGFLEVVITAVAGRHHGVKAHPLGDR